MIRKWKKFPFSWLIPVLFFAALWLLGQRGSIMTATMYIAMHIHREPLYSFFLWIFRSLFGETKYLDIVRFLQNGLAAFSVIWLAEEPEKTICIRAVDGSAGVPDLTGAPHYHAGIFCERTGFVERRHQRSGWDCRCFICLRRSA